MYAEAVAGYARGFTRGATARDAWDDSWYEGSLSDIVSSSAGGYGVAVTADTVINCGVVFGAINYRANIFSQCQPSVIQKLANGRKDLPDSPVWALLRDPEPETNLTGVAWRHLMMFWVQLYGNAYAQIIGGPSYFAERLMPMEPWNVSVVGNRPNGANVYEYADPMKNGAKVTLNQEKVLHFRGPSTDGHQGLAMWRLIRNAVAIAQLAEAHTSASLRKGNRLAGFLVPKGDAGGDDQRKALAASVNEAFAGPSNTGQLGVLPYEVEFQPAATNNREAQLLELRDWQVGDILRFLGIPGVVVGYGDKTATYASAEAFFEDAKRCVLPWVVNFEAQEEKQLLLRGSGQQVKHNLDAVLRADTSARYEALSKATGGRGWVTPNEAREMEDMSRIETDPTMDQVAPAANASPNDPERQGAPPAGRKLPAPPPPADDAANEARDWHRRQMAVTLAAREVRKEIKAISGSGANGGQGAALRFAKDPAGWRAWATDYYAKHAPHVAALPGMNEGKAREYCDGQLAALLGGGVAATEAWETEATARLAWMILGEE